MEKNVRHEKNGRLNFNISNRDFLDFCYVVVRSGVGMGLLFFKDG